MNQLIVATMTLILSFSLWEKEPVALGLLVVEPNAHRPTARQSLALPMIAAASQLFAIERQSARST